MKNFCTFFICVTAALCLTAASAIAGQAPVVLGSTAKLVALAGSTVTNTGTSPLTGDIGVSPGTAVTGFTGGMLIGTIHAGDAVAAQAQLDLTTAYNDAAGRTTAAVTVAGNLGGQTLAPGLYKSTSSLEISSGDLTLDAQGDPNAVFIFQVASTLTVTSGRQVILSGSAMASNVFWQVGSSATLGTTSVFKGTILANISISMTTGATLEGRLLARSGAVTLSGSTISTPTPAINQFGIVNAASFVSPVAAGSIATAFGTNLAFQQEASLNIFPVPTTLAGSSFQVGGRGMPLFFVMPSQVNLQIPWELAGLTQGTVSATVGGVASGQQAVSLAAFAPGIFTLNQQGTGQGAVLISGTALLAAPQRPALRGEFVSIFCTGLGPVSNQPATGAAAQADPLSIASTWPAVTIGGIVASLNFAGLAPGFAGLYQVNALVPASAPTGDAVPVVLSIGNATSNTVTISVR